MNEQDWGVNEAEDISEGGSGALNNGFTGGIYPDWDL